MMANAIFLIATCCLVIHTFNRGKSCYGCSKKKRRIKRAAFTLLCGIVLFGFAAINDLVRRGSEYITLPLMVFYGIILFLLLTVFFGLRYWHNNVDKAS